MYGDMCWKVKINRGVNINNFEKIIGENLENEDDGFKKEYKVCLFMEKLIIVDNFFFIMG